MAETTYHLFEVYDYKDGELCTNTNLTREELVRELARLFENIDIEIDDPTEEDIRTAITEKYDDGGFISTYACWGYFCGRIYKCEENKLEHLRMYEFLEEIITYVYKEYYE